MLQPPEQILDLIAQEQYDKAQQALKEQIAAFPDQHEFYNLYAYCEQCIEDICENEPVDEMPLFNTSKKLDKLEEIQCKAHQLADQGNYRQAYNLLRLIWSTIPLLEKSPYAPALPQPRALVRQEVALCAFLQGDTETAAQHYQKSLQEEINARQNTDYKKIDYCLQLKDYQQAIAVCKACLQTPHICSQSEIFYTLSHIYKILENSKQTIHYLQKAFDALQIEIKMSPLSYHLYHKQAKWLIELKDYPAALLANAKAIALWPRYFAFHLQRAEIYAHQHKTEQARQKLALLQSGTLYGQTPYLEIEMGRVFELLGEPVKAAALYRTAALPRRLYYDNLFDFYKRHGCKHDIETLRQAQRQEPHFQDRVSLRELAALIPNKQ